MSRALYGVRFEVLIAVRVQAGSSGSWCSIMLR